MPSLAIFRQLNSLPDNAKGAVTLLVAALFFTLMTTLIKLLGSDLHVTQILFVRQCVMTAIVAPMVMRGFPGALKTHRPGLQLLRIAFALVAMLAGFTAVIHLPLADATALGFAKSFFVTIFAMMILSETVGPRRWGAVAAGFIGVLVMLRPGSDGMSVYGLMAVIGAGSAGLVMVIIRLMSRTESSTTILTWQALGVGFAMAIPAFLYWRWPTPYEWTLLVAMGAVSYAGQMFNIVAYKWGEASVMASLDYTRLIYAAILGYFVFGNLPGINTWLGALIIIAASLYTIRREASRRQKLVTTPEGRGYS